MDRVFRVKRAFGVRLVEVVAGERVLFLPLKPSLQVAEHSPDGFNWRYEGSGPVQLALGILYEVTGNVEVSRNFYQLFKLDHVQHWGDRWEMSECEVREWLRAVGTADVSC